MSEKELAFIFYRCLLAMADGLAKYWGFGRFAPAKRVTLDASPVVTTTERLP